MMDSFGGSGFNNVTAVTKKRRSTATRRPRPDSQFVVDGHDGSAPSSTPSVDTGSKLSPCKDVIDDASFRKKDFNLNSSGSRASSLNKTEGVASSKKVKKDDKKYRNLDDGSDTNRKKQKEVLDVLPDARSEPLTTSQRALQSGKGVGSSGSIIEFPDGLPPVAPRKQRGKLSEEEQQVKKTEAAQRRRLLVKKQAEELEAEAIKKILGQDSGRKKKEEKECKERYEKAQKKAAESLVLASSTIRWVMGPTGTIVTFADDVGLPNIFGSNLSSYPPPREKCAGPSCTNAFKYRDSKLNVPLCSLHCYKAV